MNPIAALKSSADLTAQLCAEVLAMRPCVSSHAAHAVAAPVQVVAAHTQAVAPPIPIGNIPISKQGQYGEDYVEKILREKFTGVTNVSREPKSGDLTLSISHRKITIEVKNYTNVVPTSAIDKFRRDLQTSGCAGGVFCSLGSAITGVSGGFDLRYEHAGHTCIPCAYVCSADPNMIVTACTVVSNIIDSYAFVVSEVYAQDTIAGAALDLAAYLDDIGRARNELTELAAATTARMNKLGQTIAGAELGVRRVLAEIQGELATTIRSDEILARLDTLPGFQRCALQTREYIRDLIVCINEVYMGSPTRAHGSVWRTTARSCVHDSGIRVVLAPRSHRVVIPRVLIAGAAYADAGAAYADAAYADAADVVVPINADTAAAVRTILCGEAKNNVPVDDPQDVLELIEEIIGSEG